MLIWATAPKKPPTVTGMPITANIVNNLSCLVHHVEINSKQLRLSGSCLSCFTSSSMALKRSHQKRLQHRQRGSAVVNTCHQQQKPLWTPNTSIGLLAGKGPWVHLYMIFVDFLGCISTCREAKWRWQTAEILKHGNRRTCAEKGQDLMKTLDLIFNVSTRFRIHPCGERSERWNSQSRPVVVVTWIGNLWPELPRWKIEHQILSGTPHKPGSEWWQWSQYLCSVHSWNKVQLNVSALRNYLCSGWLPNMTQQLQTSQCETSIAKFFSTIHSAFVEVGSWSSRSRNQTCCLTKWVGYGEIVTFDMNSGLCKHHNSSRKSMVSMMEAW